MPAPQGQTFIVVPGEGMAANGGLEFQRYAGIVAQQIQARGYTPAPARECDHGRSSSVTGRPRPDRIVDDRLAVSCTRSRRNRSIYPRSASVPPFSYGWNDPFWFGGGGYSRGIDSYVEYHSEVDLHIRAAGNNQPLFDGRAQARSQTNRLDMVLPSLVEAMFTNFPGQNGETVKITIPTKPKS